MSSAFVNVTASPAACNFDLNASLNSIANTLPSLTMFLKLVTVTSLEGAFLTMFKCSVPVTVSVTFLYWDFTRSNLCLNLYNNTAASALVKSSVGLNSFSLGWFT